MPVYRLDEMAWPDIEKSDREKTLIFFPVSPLEEHGPHLPIGTDFYGARDLAELAVDIICRREPEATCLLAPPLPIGASPMNVSFPGTLSVGGRTLSNLLYDLCASLAQHGFRHFFAVNHHLDSIHVKAIMEADKRLLADFSARLIDTCALSVFTGMSVKMGQALKERGIDHEKEAHAETVETSFILHSYPDLIKGDWKSLPPVFVDMEEQVKQGKFDFKEMGAVQGYIGSPSNADPEIGRLHLEDWAETIAEIAVRVFRGEPLPEMSERKKEYFDRLVLTD